MKILIKALQPHRQKILTADGEEMRLQQWANKQAASALRGAGGDAQGEQFTQTRDGLMRDAVANPDEHGLKFMGERMPFEGQELEESLSEPDVEGEQAAIDGEFAGEEEEPETPDLFDEGGKLRDGTPPEEEEFNPDKEAEHTRRIMNSRDVPMRDAWSILKEEGKRCPIHGEFLRDGGAYMDPVCRECLRGANPTDGSPKVPYPNQYNP